MMNPEIILGPPGTGKTETLLGLVEQELNKGTKPDKIGFVSFTKQATEEAITRACQKFGFSRRELPFFRTLHSMCFHQLGMRRADVLEGKRMQEFARYAGVRITSRWSDDGTLAGFTPGDRAVFLENLSRVRMRPLEEEYREDVNDGEGLKWSECKRISLALRQFKQERGLYDFTDMLQMFVAAAPRLGLEVLFGDEYQDNSILQEQVFQQAAQGCRRVVVAGDDDQCQPAGTLVSLSNGELVAIESLKTNDQVKTYSRGDLCFYDKPVNEIAHRKYTGNLYSLNTSGRTTQCTAQHQWLIKWTNESKQSGSYVVYLMRKDDRFRVGYCLMWRGTSFHLTYRANQERADYAWILGVFPTQKEAFAYEQIISAKYGLPQVTFGPFSGVNKVRTQQIITHIFASIDSKASGLKVLRDHDLLERLPLINKLQLNYSRWGATINKIAACNLVSGHMAVPVPSSNIILKGKKTTVKWELMTINHHKVKNISVYSLDIDKYHTYVSNNIVTCNSIYRWSGANVEGLINLPGEPRVLGQSFRVPICIQALANMVINQVANRRAKAWMPREEPGLLDRAIDFDDADTNGPDVLVLARNSYILNEQVEPALRRRGVYYERNGRLSIEPRLLNAVQDWERLRAGQPLSPGEAKAAAEHCSRVRWSAALDEYPEVRSADLGVAGGLPIWYEALDRIPPAIIEYMRAARSKGEKLRDKPRVRVSTIHSAKGAEALHVILFQEMAPRSYRDMERRPEDEARVFYVGVTRARERLTLVGSQSPNRYRL